MSSNIGAAFGAGLALYPDDKSHCDESWHSGDELAFPDPLISLKSRNDVADFFGGASYRTPWWPCSGLLLGDMGSDVSMLHDRPPRYGDVWYASGCNGRLAIVGVTRNAYGSAVGGCTVKIFRTNTDELLSTVISDPNTGEYTITTPYYPDGHYLVVYKSGTPDMFGTTVNTLVGG